MRRFLLIVALAACKKSPEAPTPRPVVTKDAAVDDARVDAVVDADEDPYAWLDREAIGPLKMNMADVDVLAALGKPRRKSPVIEEGATGEFVSDWAWPGVSLKMGGDTAKGPFKVRSISIAAPSVFATNRGIHVGSTVAELQAAYTRNTDEGDGDPDQYLVGSVYGGMLFGLKGDKVATIFLGAMAF